MFSTIIKCKYDEDCFVIVRESVAQVCCPAITNSDGKEGAGGFKGWWGKYGKERFPEAYGICEILAAG
jgi:hypothetical protein